MFEQTAGFKSLTYRRFLHDFYKGPEGIALETETIFQTRNRLTAARNVINNVNPPIGEAVGGDYFRDCPSEDYGFYFQNRARIGNAKALTDGFKVPVHVGLFLDSY